MEVPSDVDFLSFCPSLVDILQYMTISDYDNCHLVNRRIRDVINANSVVLKPTARHMFISDHTTVDGKHTSISVVTRTTSHFAFLTSKMIVFQICYKTNDCNYFAETGFQGLESHESAFVGSNEKRFIKKMKGRNAETKGLFRIYQTNSLEEGLKRVLTPFARRYHWRKLIMSSDISPTSLNVVSEVWHHNRSRCLSLEVPMSPGIVTLIRNRGCSHITFNIATDGSFIDEFFEIFHLQRRMKVTVDSYYVSLTTLLVPLLQRWLSGLFSVDKKCLMIFITFVQPVSWIDDLKASLQHSAVVLDTTNTKQRILVLRRHADHKLIKLVISKSTYVLLPNSRVVFEV